jgi:hypothetical protein
MRPSPLAGELGKTTFIYCERVNGPLSLCEKVRVRAGRSVIASKLFKYLGRPQRPTGLVFG